MLGMSALFMYRGPGRTRPEPETVNSLMGGGVTGHYGLPTPTRL